MNLLKISIVIACLGIFWFSTSVQRSYADGFLDFPIRLTHSPTVCALEPQRDPQYPNVGKQMLDETDYAVLDWKGKLNLGIEKRPLWNITLVEVPLAKQSGFDYSNCDITINFFRTPSDPSLKYAVTGMTIPNFEDGKTRIEIYYLGIQIVSKMVEWQVGDTTYYKYVDVPQYTGFIANEPQLAGTIRHELGHSFGLGHYIVSPTKLQSIVVGIVDMPSIMIDTTTIIGVTHYDITPLDIEEIKSIYGPNGFNGNSAHNQFSRIEIISTDKSSYGLMNPIHIGINTNDFNSLETGSLLVLDPQNSLIGIGTVTKTNSTFLLQNQNKTGKYYLEYLDNQKEMYDYSSFTVSDRTSIPSWIKNNARWWSEGALSDKDFIQGIQYMIQQKIIEIPPTSNSSNLEQISPWVKNTAGWWANGQISDDEFIRAIQYLVTNGIIKI